MHRVPCFFHVPYAGLLSHFISKENEVSGQVDFSVISPYSAKARFELGLSDSKTGAMFPASPLSEANPLKGRREAAYPPEKPVAICPLTYSFRAHTSTCWVSGKERKVKWSREPIICFLKIIYDEPKVYKN